MKMNGGNGEGGGEGEGEGAGEGEGEGESDGEDAGEGDDEGAGEDEDESTSESEGEDEDEDDGEDGEGDSESEGEVVGVAAGAQAGASAAKGGPETKSGGEEEEGNEDGEADTEAAVEVAGAIDEQGEAEGELEGGGKRSAKGRLQGDGDGSDGGDGGGGGGDGDGSGGGGGHELQGESQPQLKSRVVGMLERALDTNTIDGNGVARFEAILNECIGTIESGTGADSSVDHDPDIDRLLVVARKAHLHHNQTPRETAKAKAYLKNALFFTEPVDDGGRHRRDRSLRVVANSGPPPPPSPLSPSGKQRRPKPKRTQPDDPTSSIGTAKRARVDNMVVGQNAIKAFCGARGGTTAQALDGLEVAFELRPEGEEQRGVVVGSDKVSAWISVKVSDGAREGVLHTCTFYICASLTAATIRTLRRPRPSSRRSGSGRCTAYIYRRESSGHKETRHLHLPHLPHLPHHHCRRHRRRRCRHASRTTRPLMKDTTATAQRGCSERRTG